MRFRSVVRQLILASAMTAIALPVAAQADSGAPPPPAAPAAAPAPAAQSGEIVVTAQRRAERLQDVPLSITAISGAEIRNRDLTDATRLEQVVPGLRIGRSGPATRPAIRGVYTEAIGINADPRIGFYIDDIYQSRTQQGSAAFVDLERVEVQKGPQGTLFGRNSLGGNIALISALPKDHWEGGVDLLYGNYNRFKGEGWINVPVAEGLAFRISASGELHDGYLQSTVNKRADLDDKGDYFVRGAVRWTPPTFDGRLEVLAHASYYREADHGFNTFNAKLIGALVDPSLITPPGGTVTYNGVGYPVPQGYNGGNYTGFLFPYSTAFRTLGAQVNGASIGIPIPGPYQSIYDFPSFQRTEQQNYDARITLDLNRFVRLRSITGYTAFKTLSANDGDGGPAPISEGYYGTKAYTFSQELQLQSNDHSSPFQYTIGGFYLNDLDYDGSATIGFHNYTTLTAAAQGLPVLYAGGSACGFTFQPNTTSCLIDSTNFADSLNPERARTRSYAGYAQASYTFARKLTFTGGVRYTSDHKTFANVVQDANTTYVGTYAKAQGLIGNYHAEFPLDGSAGTRANFMCGGFTPGTFAAQGSNVIVGAVPNYYQTRCGDRTFSFVTYRAAVDYKLTPRNLLYASFSTGRHSGGFGASYAPSTAPQGVFGTYDSEGVDAYEIGSKNEFFGHRLQVNLAAYYNKYNNVQVQGLQYIPAINGSITTIFNGPTEHAPGLDLEIVAHPVQRLMLNFALNYVHARYDIYGQPIYYSGLCTISQAPGSPCQGFGSTALTPAQQQAYFNSQGGLGSGFFPNPQTNPELFKPFTFKTLADGTVIVTSYQSLIFNRKTEVQNTPDWQLHYGAAYVFDLGHYGKLTPDFNTLFSSSYLLSASLPNFRQKGYFKTDLRLNWTSANQHFTGQLFVENLENVATIDRATTASLAVSGSYADPRTFGVRLGFRY